MVFTNLVDLKICNVFPEYFVGISALYILVVIVLITYNVYGFIVQKALSECVGLTFLLACYLILNDDLVCSGSGFECFSVLGFYKASITDYFSFFTKSHYACWYDLIDLISNVKVCSQIFFFYFVLKSFALLLLAIAVSHPWSAICKEIKDFFLQVHVLSLLHSEVISFFIRLTLMVVVTLLSCPEYTYCMEIDSAANSSNVEYTICHWQGLSEAQLKLNDLKANLEVLKKPVNDGSTTNFPQVFDRMEGARHEIGEVQNIVEEKKKDFLAPVDEVSDQLDSLEIVLNKHASHIRDHDTTLNGDSELRRVVNQIKWNSTTALGVLGVALAGMAIILIKSSKS